MAGTGLYAVKVTPTKLDRTQSGAPVGQTITLSSGGLGTADAYKGGYIENVTESEIRAIVSHIDDKVTLEGDLANWSDTDDLDVYDAWDTIMGACDQLWIDQGVAAFTAEQVVEVYTGTYTETVLPNTGLVPALLYWFVLRAASGQTPLIDGESIRDYGIYCDESYTLIKGFKVTNCVYGIRSIGYGIVEDCECYGCTYGMGWMYYHLVRNCYVHDNTSWGVLYGYGSRWDQCMFADNPSHLNAQHASLPTVVRSCVFDTASTSLEFRHLGGGIGADVLK